LHLPDEKWMDYLLDIHLPGCSQSYMTVLNVIFQINFLESVINFNVMFDFMNSILCPDMESSNKPKKTPKLKL